LENACSGVEIGDINDAFEVDGDTDDGFEVDVDGDGADDTHDDEDAESIGDEDA